MESVNIISKEIITKPIAWPSITIAIISIIAIVGVLIYLFITKNDYIATKYLCIFGFGGISLMMISLLMCSTFFRVPTSRYKYEGTINKDIMTVIEYEEFTSQYNFRETMQEGIYYWEDPIE